jgi:hypothetical protein
MLRCSSEELAPKLGIAFAAETEGDTRTAAAFYDRVSRVDPDHTSACFGLARIRVKVGDRDGMIGAVEALRRVPASSSLYAQAQIRLADLLIDDGNRFDHNNRRRRPSSKSAWKAGSSISLPGGCSLPRSSSMHRGGGWGRQHAASL